MPLVQPLGQVFPAASALMPGRFEALIGLTGQRLSWRRSHTCPCVFAGSSNPQRLSTPGSPQKDCATCHGLGTYWDAPSVPFAASLSFMHLSPSPDEPGNVMNERFGLFQSSEPAVTIPKYNPYLSPTDPAQPTTAWTDASVDDIFVAVDMPSRFTAALVAGVQENLPYQQSLSVAATGAVTIWDQATKAITFVSGYTVSGATVTLPSGYQTGQKYMVDFQAAPLYVAFRRAGGVPHVRPLDGGQTNEPRRFRLQALDFWTRDRGIQQQVPV